MTAADHEAAIREALLANREYSDEEHAELLAHLDALVGLLQQAEQEAEGSQRDADRWAHIAAADSARAVEAVARAERAEQERDEACEIVEQLRKHGGDWIVEGAHRTIETYRAQLVALDEVATRRYARVRVLEEALRDLLETWDESADVLGPEWNGIADRIEAAHRALAAAAPPEPDYNTKGDGSMNVTGPAAAPQETA